MQNQLDRRYVELIARVRAKAPGRYTIGVFVGYLLMGIGAYAGMILGEIVLLSLALVGVVILVVCARLYTSAKRKSTEAFLDDYDKTGELPKWDDIGKRR